MIETTANEVINSGLFFGKPGNNDAFLAAVSSNRKTVRNTINYRRKTRAKIKKIHDRKIILCASKDGTFERENCFVTPRDGLNGRDASRLRAPWLHFTLYIPNKFGELESKKLPGEEKLSQELCNQRTLPPSGRVTTLVPRPFFFRRAFIAIEFRIKNEYYRVIEEIDG